MEIALRAVLFDLGTTLIRTAPVPEIFNRLLAPHGIQRPTEEIDAALRKVSGNLKPEDYAAPYIEFWRLYNMKILEHVGIHGNLESLADEITNRWWGNADVELYPEVKETLKALREMGLKVGIVTNGYQTDIDEILARTGLAGAFDVTVGADAVGLPKPSKKIFLHALKELEVPAEETLFVGDNLKLDYEGAEDAGLNPLLIDRDNGVHEGIRRIRDLREVVRYL